MPLHPSLLTSIAPIASGPDAEIIAACNRFAELEASRHVPDYPDDGFGSPFLEEYEKAYEAVLHGRATTQKGFFARARAVAMYIYPDTADEWHWCMVEALLADMLGLPVEGDETCAAS